MQGNAYLADFLARIGVERVYLLSGGMIAPLIDAIGEHPALTLVNSAHEQAGGFGADAEARLRGPPGVVLGTSGPGALNLVSCLAQSFYDSVPMLAIGGQVQGYLQRGTRHVRQFALQECDFPSVAAPISKAVFAVKSAQDLPRALAAAYVAAMSGRPGPAVLDITFDAQIGDAGVAEVETSSLLPPAVPRPSALSEAMRALAVAERPLVLAGGGVRCAGAQAAVRDFCGRFRLPMATTVAALDVVPRDPAMRVGMPGTYGTRAANMTMDACDLLLVMGSRLDHGVLGADPEAFARRRTIVHVDVDSGELAARVRGTVKVEGHLAAVVPALEHALAGASYAVPAGWLDRVAAIAAAWPDTGEHPADDGIDPNRFAAALGKRSREAGAFCVDAGQHTWFCAQSLRLHPGQRFVSSTGLWSMGTAIPAAIGAALAMRKPAVAVAGDASVQLNIQELAVATRQNLPLKVVVLDNGAQGMVRQFQAEFLAGRHHGTLWGYAPPDLCAILTAYGFESRSVDQAADVDEALDWLWSDASRRQFLRVAVGTAVDVRPSVPFGRQLRDMRPVQPVP